MSQGPATRVHEETPGTGDGTEVALKALNVWWVEAGDKLDQQFSAQAAQIASQTAKIDELVTGQQAQQKDLAALKADVTEIKDEQNEMKKRLQALEKNQSCSGSQTSTTDGEFIPSYLDFRKFCAFEDHKEHGITRQQAMELIAHLT
jgi:septal ring factor EnvC (AmiA/AmiB activator)